MVIKSAKENIRILTLENSCVIAAVAVMIYEKFPVWLWMGLVGIDVMFSVCSFIETSRTLIMDEDGCTVCFWRYRKRYSWNELQVKRIENYAHNARYYPQYAGCAIFSPHKIRKSLWSCPVQYGFFCPLSFIFVCFPHKRKLSKREYWSIMPDVYSVDEEEFRSKMELWNVELEEFCMDRYHNIYKKNR